MKNSNIKQIVFTATTALLLSACSSDSSSSTPADAMISQSYAMVSQCSDTMTQVNGKTIVKTEEGAEVKIVHATDGTKQACMISGSAKIVDN